MKRHAEIAGAGIAGLTAAAVLAQRGWSVRVHEKGTELREIGAGIFVWENGIRVLEAIGAFERATARAEPIRYWELRDQRRRLLQGSWMMAGARLYLILRTELHQVLAETAIAAGAEIVTDSTVSHTTREGELVLEDGSRLRADLIVEGKLIVELKSIEQLARVHKKQLLTHLRLANCRLGLLINFHVALIKDGITRIVNGPEDDDHAKSKRRRVPRQPPPWDFKGAALGYT